MKKGWLGLALIAVLTFGMQMTAHAENENEKIEDVSIVFSYDEEPESGGEIGSISAHTNDSDYSVDYAEYLTENDYWNVGERPRVRVYLYAKEGYYFGYASKSHIKISGCEATYKSAKKQDNGTTMVLEVYLERVGGKLSGAEGLDWNGTTAVWDELYGAERYEVRLRRDGNTVKTVKTEDTYYDFAANFQKKGDYSFSVRGIALYNNRVGEWSDESDSYYADEEDIWHETGTGTWKQDQRGWRYHYTNGGNPEMCWKYIYGIWYYFDREGYITTGWQYIDNEWYFLNNNGAMQIGWQLVNGRWYYMESNGVMQTGWRFIGDKWYCMDSSGAMYADTVTPDGYTVDASGARVD